MTTVSYQKQIQSILARFYFQKSLIENPLAEPDPFDKDPPRNARSFRQTSSDTQTDSLQTARNIGTLIRGKTRLNVVSALTSNDLVDFYSFKTTKEGKLGLSVTTDKNVRIQLIAKNGNILADSEALSGTEKATNFEKLGAQKLEVDPGQYFIKVTRATGLSRSDRPNFAIQISMSKYFEEDYDTVETPAAKAAPARTTTSSTQGALNSVLNQLGYGNLFDFKA